MQQRLTERILFNGHDLTLYVHEAHVIDINIGAIEIQHRAQEKPMSAGSIFSGKRDGTRTIKLTVELPMRKDLAAIAYNRLRAWAESNQPAPMYLPVRTNGHINVILESISDLPIATYYEPIVLTFRAYDPYFYSEPKSTTVGSKFVVNGDVAADYTITVDTKQALQSPEWQVDGVRRFRLVGSVPVGKLVIDTESGNVTAAGKSIKNLLDISSRFFPLEVGEHTIASASGGTVTWVERWR